MLMVCICTFSESQLVGNHLLNHQLSITFAHVEALDINSFISESEA